MAIAANVPLRAGTRASLGQNALHCVSVDGREHASAATVARKRVFIAEKIPVSIFGVGARSDSA